MERTIEAFGSVLRRSRSPACDIASSRSFSFDGRFFEAFLGTEAEDDFHPLHAGGRVVGCLRDRGFEGLDRFRDGGLPKLGLELPKPLRAVGSVRTGTNEAGRIDSRSSTTQQSSTNCDHPGLLRNGSFPRAHCRGGVSLSLPLDADQHPRFLPVQRTKAGPLNSDAAWQRGGVDHGFGTVVGSGRFAACWSGSPEDRVMVRHVTLSLTLAGGCSPAACRSVRWR